MLRFCFDTSSSSSSSASSSSLLSSSSLPASSPFHFSTLFAAPPLLNLPLPPHLLSSPRTRPRPPPLDFLPPIHAPPFLLTLFLPCPLLLHLSLSFSLLFTICLSFTYLSLALSNSRLPFHSCPISFLLDLYFTSSSSFDDGTFEM